MLTALAVLAALAFVVVLAFPFCHGTDEQDRFCSRVDRNLDERMRRQYGGWRW